VPGARLGGCQARPRCSNIERTALRAVRYASTRHLPHNGRKRKCPTRNYGAAVRPSPGEACASCAAPLALAPTTGSPPAAPPAA
jgi:hypothetical protein